MTEEFENSCAVFGIYITHCFFDNKISVSLEKRLIQNCMSSIKQVNKKELRDIRKKLRNNPTPAESALWVHLKANKLEGTHWRRQFSVGDYILDFYCPKYKLCVELDGKDHYTIQGDTNDYDRSLFLQSVGINVLRFENKEVWEDIERVLDTIKLYLII